VSDPTVPPTPAQLAALWEQYAGWPRVTARTHFSWLLLSVEQLQREIAMNDEYTRAQRHLAAFLDVVDRLDAPESPMPTPDYDTTLARIAGNIAAGLVRRDDYLGPEGTAWIAEVAVDLARQIVTHIKATTTPPPPR
jgi:predicted nucleic acid-binding protein